jgi:hypothetical protein
MTGAELKTFEKSFKSTTESMLQRNLRTYLSGLKEQKFNRLLQEGTTVFTVEDRNIIIGELRVIQKLLDVLEPKSEVISLTNSQS